MASVLKLIGLTLYLSQEVFAGQGKAEKDQPVQTELMSGEAVQAKVIRSLPAPDILTFGSIVIGKSTIADAQRIFGMGNLIISGDASEASADLCFKAQDGSGIIFSSGEVSGLDIIDRVDLHRSVNSFGRYIRCAYTKGSFLDLVSIA